MFNSPSATVIRRTKQLVNTINPHYYGTTSQNTPQIVQNLKRPGITIVKK